MNSNFRGKKEKCLTIEPSAFWHVCMVKGNNRTIFWFNLKNRSSLKEIMCNCAYQRKSQRRAFILCAYKFKSSPQSQIIFLGHFVKNDHV